LHFGNVFNFSFNFDVNLNSGTQPNVNYVQKSRLDGKFEHVAAPEMLDPKARVLTEEGGAPFRWISVASVPSVKEVAIQPVTTDVFLPRATHTEKTSDTVLTTRLLAVVVFNFYCHLLFSRSYCLSVCR